MKNFKIGDLVKFRADLTEKDLKRMGYTNRLAIAWILAGNTMEIKRISWSDFDDANRLYYYNDGMEKDSWIWEYLVEAAQVKRRGHLLTKIFQIEEKIKEKVL